MKKLLSFFLVLLVGSLSVLLLMGSSKCFAYSWADFDLHCQDASVNGKSTGLKNSASKLLSLKSNIETFCTNNNIDLNSYNNFLICPANGSASSFGYLFCMWNKTSVNYEIGYNGYNFCAYNADKVIKISTSNSLSVVTNVTSYYGNSTSSAYAVGLFVNDPVHGTISSSSVNGYYLQNWYVPPVVNPLNFTHMFSEDVTYNSLYCQGVTTGYNNSVTMIDSVTGYESGDYDVTLYDTVDGLFIWGVEFHDLGDYGTISCRTRTINFGRVYSLSFVQGEYEIVENVVFFPYGTVISSGVVVSLPSGDYSYNTQDSTNDLLNDDEVDDLLSQLASPTIYGILQYSDLNSSAENIVIDTIQGFCSDLLGSGDEIYTFRMHGHTYVFNSADFTTPDNGLIAFVRLALMFGILYVTYRQLMNIINLLVTFQPMEAVEYTKPDFDLWRM